MNDNAYSNMIQYLKENPPYTADGWNRENLYNYLVYSCCRDTQTYIDKYFKKYTGSEDLLKMLFDFLLDDNYDGSDSQISAAYYTAHMDSRLLEKYSSLLAEAGKNEISARNPLCYMKKD